MSRSLRKTPIIKDWDRNTKFRKRQANKKVRRYKHALSDGKMYRRLTNPYDIYDIVFRSSIHEWMADYEQALKQVENGTYSNYPDRHTKEWVEANYGYENWASRFLRR